MPFDLIEESKKLIAIRSDAGQGTREAVRYLLPFCQRLGFHVIFQSEGNGSEALDLNLIAHTAPKDSADLCPEGLLLDTHLDTVPAGDITQWTETGGDPFRATIQGDRLYGLGSADTKLDFLCKLQAIEAVGLKNLRVPIALVGTFGEEGALAGVRLLRETGLVHPRFVLVGEPSEMLPVVAHKGILYMRAVFSSPHLPDKGGPPGQRRAPLQKRQFHGRAAHGSMPHLGENAIRKAVEWIFDQQEKEPHLCLLKIEGGTAHNVVPECCEIEVSHETGEASCPRISFLRGFFHLIDLAGASLENEENQEFDPPRTTCNIGIIGGGGGGGDRGGGDGEGGDGERIEIDFDFRLIPETDGNALFEIFQRPPRERTGAKIDLIRSNPPMKTDKDGELARHVGQALGAVGIIPRFLSKSGNTEGAIWNAMGAESIVIGPGRSVGNIHAPNEYNEISQLKKAVEFYTAFLRQFC